MAPMINFDGKMPPAVIDAVKASLENMHSTFFSQKPVYVADCRGNHEGSCIASIISFVGQVPWSLAWILPKETAPVVAMKFAGFEIPYDGPDMGDLAGELVNVIAGEVVAQLEQRGLKAQMSLPTVLRGSQMDLVPEDGPSIVYLQYSSKEGPFWFRLAAARHHASRIAGS